MTLLERLVPAPLASAALLALWLLLARKASPGQLLLGVALALIVPKLTAKLLPTAAGPRRPLVALHFLWIVCWDVLMSNLDVARGVLAWRWSKPRSGFVVIPLELRNPLGLAVLSMVTTVVPGTVWSELAVDRSALLLHVWDIGDERSFVARFKARYEHPLRRIFE